MAEKDLLDLFLDYVKVADVIVIDEKTVSSEKVHHIGDNVFFVFYIDHTISFYKTDILSIEQTSKIEPVKFLIKLKNETELSFVFYVK